MKPRSIAPSAILIVAQLFLFAFSAGADDAKPYFDHIAYMKEHNLSFPDIPFEEPDPNRPLSVFEQYVKDRGGLPDSIKNLEEDYFKFITGTIFGQSASGAILGNALLIKSRAPERDAVNREFPRRIFTINGPGSNTQLTLPYGFAAPAAFIAHTPASGELQVISYVPFSKGPKYRFLIYRNYKNRLDNEIPTAVPSSVPAHLFMPKQSFCTTCHQSGGPHLTRIDWEDTNANLIVADLIKTRADGFINSPSLAQIDAAVRKATKVIQANQICENLCEDNLDCKKYLLYFALIGQHNQINAEAKQSGKFIIQLNADFAETVRALWPKDEFAHPSSVLPGFDYASREIPFSTFLRAIDLDAFIKDFRQLDEPNDLHSIAQGERIKRLNKNFDITYLEDKSDFVVLRDKIGISDIQISGEADGTSLANPAAPRPLVGHIPVEYAASELTLDNSLSTCFDLTLKDLGLIQKSTIYRLKDVIFQNTAIDSILQSWPPTREQILSAVSKKLEQQDKEERANLDPCYQIRGSRAPNASTEEITKLQTFLTAHPAGQAPTLSLDTGVKKFQEKCSTCHTKGWGGITTEMGNMEDLAHYKDGLLAKKLECFAMPAIPEFDWDPKVELSVEDRAAMIEFLKNLQQENKPAQ